MLDGLWQDVRYALRTIFRSPALAAVALASLALGIGVNIAVFGYLDSALFKPLPVERPGELVSLYHRGNQTATYFASSYPEFEFYRDHNTVFSGMLAYLRFPMIAGTGEDSRRISGELVSPDYFRVLGLRPESGRFFDAADRDPVAVISHSFWQSRFSARNVIGATIRVGSGTFTITGIAPPSFRGIVMDWLNPPDVWIPVTHYAEASPVFPFDIMRAWGMESYLVNARLRSGVTVDQAAAQMAALTARLRETQGRRREQAAVVLPLQQARFWPGYRGSIANFLSVLMAIVAVILLIACCNLANLLLARAAHRRREIAMRQALGAGRARIARQLWVESLLLAGMGGVAAFGVASAVTHFLSRFHRAFRIPLALDGGYDFRILLFAVAVSVLSGLFFGCAPVLDTWRTDLIEALKSGTRGSARSRLRSALLIGQVALSMVLLAGAGLFARTLANARAESPSTEADHLLLAGLDPGMSGYSDTRTWAFYSAALSRVRAIPGVKSAALVWNVPFGGMRTGTDIVVPDGQHQVDFNAVSPDYFRTAGLSLHRGRDFTAADTESAPPVAVVNTLFAARFFPGADPIGRQFRQTKPPRTFTVIGVVQDGKFRGYRDTLRPGFYLSAAQEYRPEMTLEVRTASEAALFAAPVRRELHGLDPTMPLPDVQTMETRLDDALSQERLIASFASGLGLLALALAAIGIYSVFSFSIARRTREIGIRMALGADPAQIVRMVLREAAIVAGGGLALGAAGAVLLARLAKALLYGVAAADPVAFGLAFLLLAIVAAAAALIPAWRAARLDPAATVRAE